MDKRPTWTDCDEVGDYVVPNVLSPRDLVSGPDIMDETVPHIKCCDQHSYMIRKFTEFSKGSLSQEGTGEVPCNS